MIVVDAIAGEKGLLALLQARREYAALERSLERARAENADLREQARRLREDPSAVEDQARRELGLIKPGEVGLLHQGRRQETLRDGACAGAWRRWALGLEA